MQPDPAIRDLYNEHNGITVMLEILHAITAKLRAGSIVPKADLVHIVDFLSVFADKCHHGKEEGLLIPALKKSPRSDSNLLSDILGEHKTGRDLIAGMRASLGSYKKGHPELYHFTANAEAYITLLTDHIRKENVILFPAASQLLGDKQKQHLFDKFNLLEENVIGHGKHEALHSLLKSLQKKYL